MDPINYLAGVPQEDFARDIAGGLQLGATIQQLQQQRAAQQLALQRTAQYQADVSTFMQNPTPQAAAALQLRYPDQYEPIAKAWAGLNADQQKNELQDTYSIASTLHAGRADLALQQIDDRIQAAKNSGLPTADLEALRTQVEKDPKAAYGQVLHIVSALPGGDKILSNLSTVGKEARDQSESDVTVAGKQADNTLKNLGIVAQKAGALAKPGVKPAQAEAMFRTLAAQGIIPKDDLQGYIDGIPTDAAALPDYLAGIRDMGIKPDEQKKFTTPTADAQLSARTQVQTTGMNNATQLKVQQMIADRQDSKGDTEPTLDPDTLTTMAQQYLAGDKSVMQNLGRGAQGAANIVALRQAITKEAKAQGLSGPQIAAKMADYAGMTAGLRTSANISARVENAISEAKELAPLAIAAGREVSRSGFLPFGKAEVMFNTQTNDPALKKFVTANNGLVSAYAGAMARGQKPTVSDYDHARAILSAAQSQQAYEATVNQMFAEMAAASRAPQNVRSHLRDQIGGGAHAASGAAADHPADISALLSKYGKK